MRRREFAPRAVIVREGSSDNSASSSCPAALAVHRKDPESGIDFLLAELAEGEMVRGDDVVDAQAAHRHGHRTGRHDVRNH